MTAGAIALVVIVGIVLCATAVGFYARGHRKMDLEQWTVAGRGFGLVLMWLLNAGEIYTTFTFLGASGWAYSRGGPTLYILAYGTLGYVVSFFVLPPLWEEGRKFALQTQPDFFGARYNSKYLAALVSLVGVAFIVPNLQLQLTGLGIIVQVASFDTIGRAPAMIVAVALLAGFVLTSGLRAVVWVSVIKDSLLLCVAVFVGIGIPRIYFGGIGPMFAALAIAKPTHLVMPGATANLGHTWYISTVLLSALGFYMWPHVFAAAFSAKDAATLRRNAIVMPFYQLTMALMLFVGFSAILVIPGLNDGDLSLLTIVRKTFPPWFLGIVGGAGALAAMVPAANLILTGATSFAKNLYKPILSPQMADNDVAGLARITVVLLSLLSLYLALKTSVTLVSLLLLGYAGMAQFFPGVVLGLFWKRVTSDSVLAGIALGVGTVVYLVVSKRDPLLGLNVGLVGLCVNFLTTTLLSLLAPSSLHSRASNS